MGPGGFVTSECCSAGTVPLRITARVRFPASSPGRTGSPLLAPVDPALNWGSGSYWSRRATRSRWKGGGASSRSCPRCWIPSSSLSGEPLQTEAATRKLNYYNYYNIHKKLLSFKIMHYVFTAISSWSGSSNSSNSSACQLKTKSWYSSFKKK